MGCGASAQPAPSTVLQQVSPAHAKNSDVPAPDRHPGAVTATASQGVSERICTEKAAPMTNVHSLGSSSTEGGDMDLYLEDVTGTNTPEQDSDSLVDLDGPSSSSSSSQGSLSKSPQPESADRAIAKEPAKARPASSNLVVEDVDTMSALSEQDDKRCMDLVKDEAPAEPGQDERAIDFLARVPVLQSLNDSDLPLLAEAMNRTVYQSGEVVITQGSVGNRLYIVLSGTADVVLRKDDQETKLVTLAPGDYFGERELLHEEAARATVRAGPKGQLLTYSIARDKFWQLGLNEKLSIPRRRAVVNWRDAGHGYLAKQMAPTKTPADLEFVAKALRANEFIPSFCELTDSLVSDLAARARMRSVDVGEVLMSQGDLHVGCLCIVQQGGFDIKGRGRRRSFGDLAGAWDARVKSGDSFGELELLYSLPCQATVTAIEKSKVWTISRCDFTQALDNALSSRLEGYAHVLRGVDIFKSLYNEELRALAATLTEVNYTRGQDIITEGEIGDTCFVLVEGEVVVTTGNVELDRQSASRASNKAELFGADELLRPSPRVATVSVISESACVLAMDKGTFEIILEPLSEILYAASAGTERDCKERSPKTIEKTICKRWSTVSNKSNSSNPFSGSSPVARADLRLLGNLGSGAFGSVELAEESHTGRRFALKRVDRRRLAGGRECRQVLAEKSILTVCKSPFLVKLYGTYRDADALSFLLELVTGGDLYHAYCHFGCYGNKKCARFYTAGVALALEHLHERHIIHRDIKPENVLLDANGWPKVTDFGLAKFCVGRTFTRCGTPNYVAPEIVSEIGHGPAVDWWSLGILMYEMMAASTPFESLDGDFLKTCKLSMQGISAPDLWFWPDGFGEVLPRAISQLLQPNPLKRLPMQPGGMQQFKAHDWFDSLEWSAYEAKQLQAPVTPKPLLVEQLKASSLSEGEWKGASFANSDWDIDF